MKSWTCIENCGACCKFNLDERSDLADKLSKEDIALINSMTAKDGWCKNLDRENKKCLIYENRPHFCRVNDFSISLGKIGRKSVQKRFRERRRFRSRVSIDFGQNLDRFVIDLIPEPGSSEDDF